MDSASQSNVRVASEPSAIAGDNTVCDGRTFGTAENSATAGEGAPRRHAPGRDHPMATGEGRVR